jgi:hypothetical protein
MPANRESPLFQSSLPSGPRADRRRLVQQPSPLRLAGAAALLEWLVVSGKWQAVIIAIDDLQEARCSISKMRIRAVPFPILSGVGNLA